MVLKLIYLIIQSNISAKNAKLLHATNVNQNLVAYNVIKACTQMKKGNANAYIKIHIMMKKNKNVLDIYNIRKHNNF